MHGALAGPPGDAPRHGLIDALRGLALLGIVVVNAQVMGISTFGFTAASASGPADAAAVWAVTALLQGKCYPLFAFLFGYGLQAQLQGPRPRLRRRLWGLALLGLAHGLLLFVGDVLLLYAVLATALLPHAQASHRSLVRRAALWGCAVGGFALAVWFIAARWGIPAWEDGDGSRAALEQAMASPAFLDSVLARALQSADYAVSGLLMGATMLGVFHLGQLAARNRVLAEPERFAWLWRRGAWLGLGLGLPLNAWLGWLSLAPLLPPAVDPVAPPLGALALNLVVGPLLAWGYLSVLVGLRHRLPLRHVQAAGRLSLSVYLGESLLLNLVFAGWAGGAYGNWGAAAVTAAAVGSWALLALAAAGWVRAGWGQGPVERLLAAWMGRRAPEQALLKQ